MPLDIFKPSSITYRTIRLIFTAGVGHLACRENFCTGYVSSTQICRPIIFVYGSAAIESDQRLQHFGADLSWLVYVGLQQPTLEKPLAQFDGTYFSSHTRAEFRPSGMA